MHHTFANHMTKLLSDSVLLKVAQQAARSLSIRSDDIVEIRADIAAHEWAYGIALHLETIGAQPILTFLSVDYEHERMCAVPTERLRTLSPVAAAIAESIVATIIVKRDLRRPDSGCPKEKAAAWNQALGAITERYDARRVRFCLISHPDPIQIDNLALSREQVRDNLSKALTADLNEIQFKAQQISSALKAYDTLDVLSVDGHTLSLKITGRCIWRGDGVLRDDLVVNFPSGCVYVAPLEDSASGSLLIENWEDVENLLLTFNEGKLCGAKADRNLNRFTDLLETHTGDKDRISHVGIGINSDLHVFTGHVAIDECHAGAIFLALGENRYLGGRNASTLNTDFVCRNATVLSGDLMLVRNGALTHPL
jgi:leucyl aminopeptidase (aminopeptidase T)